MRQRGLSVVAPIQNGRVEELRELLERVRQQVIDEMNGEDSADHLIRFNDTPTHFARLVLIDQDPGYPPQLLFASNHDGDGNKYLDALIAASTLSSGENGLDLIWGHCKGYPEKGVSDPTAFKRYMYDHTFKNQTYYVCYPGITKESALNAREVFFSIGGFLDENRKRFKETPEEEIANAVRDYVKKEVAAGRLVVKTEAMPRMNPVFRLLGTPVVMVLMLVLILLAPIFFPFLLVLAVLALIVILIMYLALRRTEQREREEFERTHTSNYVPSALVLEQENREAKIAQNQMTLVNVVKPSRVRRMMLRVFLFAVDFLSRTALNQGTLGDVRTVHFARWFYVDDGNRLIFNSQFDESWQQYIGAFVDLLPIYLTGIWGNALRYPPTKNYLFEGATDIESFMQFIREFQIPSDVFYSAYSDFAAQNIVNAVRMREGLNDLLAGKTLKDPAAWLRRFAGTLALPNQKFPDPLPKRPEDPKVRDHLEDIQAWLLNGFDRARYVGYLFLKITDAHKARAWLASLIESDDPDRPTITTAAKPGVPRPINIAFTAGGLEELGLPEDAMLTFPTEFRQGIAQEYDKATTNGQPKSRSRKLGDTGPHAAPEQWDVGGPEHLFDLVLIMHARERRDRKPDEPTMMEEHIKDELARIEASGAFDVVHTEIGHRLRKEIRVPKNKNAAGPEAVQEYRDNKPIFIEHFGFRDGIAEPGIRDSKKSRGKHKQSQITIAAGEFVLGYRDQYDFFPPTPSVRNELDPNGLLQRTWRANARKDLGRNGTYVVFRKLPQDVSGFWKYFAEQSRNENGEVDADAMIKLASRTVGRWPNGVPLTLAPDEPDPYFAASPINNNFLYVKKDLHGYRCPFASHIRRSNPRDSLSTTNSLTIADRHHIIRRGAPYGPETDLPPWPKNKPAWPEANGTIPEPDGKERGLMFFCINTSFRRQFEFVQIAWNNSPRFNGLYNTSDPVMGPQPKNLTGDIALEAEPYRLRTQKCPRFTGVKGGAYLFLPGISALKFLAQLPGASTSEAVAATESASAEAIPSAAPARSESVPDDLTRIEGIGPKIAQVLHNAGIATFADLAGVSVDRLTYLLREAGLGALADPVTWPEQARLAAAADWSTLDKLQDELQGGRRM